MELDRYIEEHRLVAFESTQSLRKERIAYAPHIDLEEDMDDYLEQARKKAFRDMLYELIDQRGLDEVEVYKQAGLDRRLFSKIRSGNGYRPGKNTAIALCLALSLNLNEAEDLLETVGYSLSESETADLIVRFCIERKIYNIMQVNLALDRYDQKPLN